MTREIQLTQNKTTLVSDEDYEQVSRHKWCAREHNNRWYAVRNEGKRPNRKTVYLHRFIMNVSTDLYVDHINGDSLDNRRSNLRLCSPLENQRNRRKPKSNTSGYKGVYWNKTANKWQAQIKSNGKLSFLGLFDDPKAAAVIYDEAAKELHGEFAKTNF